jgi:phosphatidylglycerophosphate synthase
VALLFAPIANDWLCFALLALAVLGDLADGAVARRYGPTQQGAVLDMETDQLTVLVLAWLCWERGIVASVLLVPAMRWLYVLAMRWRRLPAWEPKPTGDNARGRTVCAIVVGSLLFAICPAVPTLAGGIAVHCGALLLVWSFSADARWLLAAGGRP